MITLAKLEGAYATNTVSAYERDVRKFASWCAARGYSALPAEPAAVLGFVEDCGEGLDMACGKGKAVLQAAEGIDEEYFVIANRYTMSVNEVGNPEEWVVFCAAHVEGVRLIDNVEVFD